MEVRRDKMFMTLGTTGPVVVLFLVKFAAESIEKLALDFVPVEIVGLGFLALIIHFVSYVNSTLVILRERLNGTLERVFMAGYKKYEVILGYSMAYTVVVFLQSLVLLVISKYLFGLTYGKNFPFVIMAMLLLGVVSIGLSLFLSNFCTREAHAMVALPLILIPAFLVSGLLVPLEALPKWLQGLSYLFPLRYAITATEDLVLRHKGILTVKTPFLCLLFYGFVTLLLGSFTLKDREA